jgi:pilus assembly protein Flp/PilA
VHLLSKGGISAKDKQVNNLILKAYVKGQMLLTALKDENGQDLVEYGLVLVLVCLGATAGMKTLAAGINTFAAGVSTKLATYTT